MESWVDHWASAHRRPLDTAAPVASEPSISAPLTEECSSGNATLQATDSEKSLPDPSEYPSNPLLGGDPGGDPGGSALAGGPAAAGAAEPQAAVGELRETVKELREAVLETPSRASGNASGPVSEDASGPPQLAAAVGAGPGSVYESASPEPEQRPALKQVGRRL